MYSYCRLLIFGVVLSDYYCAGFHWWFRSNRREASGKHRKSAGRETLSFRIFVLNLERRTDRLSEFSAAVRRQEPWLLPRACKLRAVDGQNRSEVQWFRDNDLVNKKLDPITGLTPGMIGCYASHWLALQQIAQDSSIDFGVVAEDDLAHFSPDFENQFARLWNNSDGGASAFWQHAEWVVLQQDGVGWPKGGARQSRPTLLRRRAGTEWPKNTAFYAVRRDTAQRLTSSSRRRSVGGGPIMPIRQEFDVAIPMHLRDMWIFEPPIAQAKHMLQEDGSSDVQIIEGDAGYARNLFGDLRSNNLRGEEGAIQSCSVV